MKRDRFVKPPSGTSWVPDASLSHEPKSAVDPPKPQDRRPFIAIPLSEFVEHWDKLKSYAIIRKENVEAIKSKDSKDIDEFHFDNEQIKQISAHGFTYLKSKQMSHFYKYYSNMIHAEDWSKLRLMGIFVQQKLTLEEYLSCNSYPVVAETWKNQQKEDEKQKKNKRKSSYIDYGRIINNVIFFTVVFHIYAVFAASILSNDKRDEPRTCFASGSEFYSCAFGPPIALVKWLFR